MFNFIKTSKKLQKMQKIRKLSINSKKLGFNEAYPGYYLIYYYSVPPLIYSDTNINMKPKITKLSNGLRIVTQQSFDPVCVVGVCVESGSQYETRKIIYF